MPDDKKDYLAIAKRKIVDASTSRRPPRFLIYSRNKKGKTRFCTTPGRDKVLILDPEDGTREMRRINPRVWHVDSWEDIDEVYKFLKLGKHEFEWFAVDGLTRISNMALRWVMKQNEERSLDSRPGAVTQRDYGRAGEMVKGLLYNLHSLPIGIVYTTQERMQEVATGDDEDEDAEGSTVAYVPDLPKGTRSTVNSLVDVIGRLYVVKTTVKMRNPKTKEVVEKEVNQRRLWLEPSILYDTGYRSDYELPPYLKNPTIPKLVQLLEEGKTQ